MRMPRYLTETLSLLPQAQIDFFGLTDYTSITGSLIIYYGSAVGTGDITNLDSLHRIVSVGEELNIFNNANLVNINGLSNLTSVGALASVPADGSSINCTK